MAVPRLDAATLANILCDPRMRALRPLYRYFSDARHADAFCAGQVWLSTLSRQSRNQTSNTIIGEPMAR